MSMTVHELNDYNRIICYQDPNGRTVVFVNGVRTCWLNNPVDYLPKLFKRAVEVGGIKEALIVSINYFNVDIDPTSLIMFDTEITRSELTEAEEVALINQDFETFLQVL